MDLRLIVLSLSLFLVGGSLSAMMVSVMQHHARLPRVASRARSAAADVLWTLVPCCMLVLLVGTSLKAAWAN